MKLTQNVLEKNKIYYIKLKDVHYTVQVMIYYLFICEKKNNTNKKI
jgi:hypothetical protein